ncbi:glutamate--tRNA ligase [Mesomycoplasma neurolyticum]|uniref:Glutamate--tRNA ligase n=1 Tax=Mesomycoplasma neurolyticum TaxID=2120 RepID=A0A449A5K1_9BACT|nr:glutamate--tRNA ligase [Mesomycoplasma neurolyticum]VEU59504.1 Glutamate--tRNA ligase [Mesomycoplasma neurolyticum]
MKKIRTRYAPSPTGFLHIGGARTALFNYLFAKHHKGEFIVRIEDTDVARNVEGGEKSQLDNLKWLGIIPNESPLKPNIKYGKYRQSEKLERYQQLINELLEKNIAYKAYETPEELAEQKRQQEEMGIFSFRYDKYWLKISEAEKKKREENKEYSVRIALPKNEIYSWNDIVRGSISVNTNDIGDWVIQKSDGYPTYNFAVVVDDHDMEISHVLRGEEHITNTPKQIGIYKAFGWSIPEFGHLTVITNMEGQKLSKRDLSLKQFIEDYKNEGYIPEAIFNFLALLGWTSKDAKEIFSQNDLIKVFDEKRLSKSPSKFDIKKMEWFSKQYMKKLDNQLIISKLKTNRQSDWLELFVNIYKQSAATIDEIQNALLIYENISFDIYQDDLHENKEVIKIFAEFLEQNVFEVNGIQNAINQTKEKTKLNGKNLFMPIRKATTLQEHGPELASSIFLFGKKVIFERLKKWK